MNLKQFSGWLKSSLPGAKFEYFVGKNTADADSPEREEMIQAAWRWAVEGRVLLFQKRREDRQFSYIAMKAPRDLDPKFIPSPFIEEPARA